MKLTEAEEQLMEMIWDRERIFMKDIIECYPRPKTGHHYHCHVAKTYAE